MTIAEIKNMIGKIKVEKTRRAAETRMAAETEMSESELEKIEAGYPSAVRDDKEKEMKDVIGNLRGEMSEDDLEKIMAGSPARR